MIVTSVDIPNIEQTITRPTIVTVLNNLKSIFRLNTNILTGIENSIEQVSNIESLMTKPIRFVYGDNQNSKLEVSYTEDTNIDRILTNNIDRSDYNPIIYDKEIDLLIKPIYYFTDLKIQLKYLTKSENEISHFTNNLKLHLVKNNDTLYHTLLHRLHIPTNLTEFLKVIYDIKENKIPTNTPIEDYLNSVSNRTLTYASSQSKQISLVHTDTQRTVVGHYSDEIENLKIEYNKDTGYYSIELQYNVSYNKPIQLYLRYPELVYSTLLPSKYLVQRDYVLEKVKDTDKESNNFIEGLQEFKVITNDGYLKIPSFDTHTLPTPKPQMIRIFSVLVIPDKNCLLCNLNNLNNFKLSPNIYQCLINGEYQHLLDPYSSVFHLEIYRGNTLLDATKYIRVDNLLNVYCIVPLDVKEVYRVSLSVIMDTDYLLPTVLTRIKGCSIINTLFKVLNIDTEYMIPYKANDYNSNRYSISVHALLNYFK